MEIERKISFVVYGMEFDNIKTAQFFVRYATAVQARVTHAGKLFYVSDVLNEMRTFTNADAADLNDEDVVAYVMALQLPKPARKKKEIQNCMKEDFSLDGPMFRDEQLEADIKAETTYFLSSNLTE